MTPSRRTKPWSSTAMLPSGNTSGMTATEARVTGRTVGASGFSYPSWKPGFYPADAKPPEFLRRYAERLPSVELNTTGYRLPAEGHFERWAAETPAGFRFAVKLPAHFTRQLGVFQERVRSSASGSARSASPSSRPQTRAASRSSSARSTRRFASPSTSTTSRGTASTWRPGSA